MIELTHEARLAEILKRDADSAATWFKQPPLGACGRAFIDRRWLLGEIARLQRECADLAATKLELQEDIPASGSETPAPQYRKVGLLRDSLPGAWCGEALMEGTAIYVHVAPSLEQIIAEKPSAQSMAMLPNKHHPGAGCSCRECLRLWPENGDAG